MDMTAPMAPYSQAVPSAEADEVASRLTSLQVNNDNGSSVTNKKGSTTAARPTPANPLPTATVRPRTGIPRYAIPYRRPPQRATSEAEQCSTATAVMELTPANGEHHEVFDKHLVSPISVASTSSSQMSAQKPPSRNGSTSDAPPSLPFAGHSAAGPGYYSRQRSDRAASEGFRCVSGQAPPSTTSCKYFFRGDSGSEGSSAFSSSGQPRPIASKIASLANANYKPGGGNVKIFDEKVNFKVAQGKCNSKANLNYKPGGGDVQILDSKLNFKETSKSKIGSLKNANHVAAGGNVKIFNEKLPWLTYNKPNLPEEERVRINKQKAPSSTTSGSSSNLS